LARIASGFVHLSIIDCMQMTEHACMHHATSCMGSDRV